MTTATRPGRWCCRVVEVAARVLPASQRQRYELEFIAELYGMPRSRQIKHSLQVLFSALQLRAALMECGTPTRQEDIVLITAKRPLRCRVGRHRWNWTSTADGDRFECCTRCGQDRTQKVGASPWRGAVGT